jgi:hypothetical protein
MGVRAPLTITELVTASAFCSALLFVAAGVFLDD